MPIYEYKCAKCDSNFEYLARNLNDAPQSCPSCASKRVTKQFSSFATNSTFQIESGCGDCTNAGACPSAGTTGAACCGGHCT